MCASFLVTAPSIPYAISQMQGSPEIHLDLRLGSWSPGGKKLWSTFKRECGQVPDACGVSQGRQRCQWLPLGTEGEWLETGVGRRHTFPFVLLELYCVFL